MNRRSFCKKGVLVSGALASNSTFLFPFEQGDQNHSDIPLVDTHLHLWNLSEMDYPWLQGADNPLAKNHLLPDYQQASDAFPISKMVFVECGRVPEQYLQEVDWVVKQSEKDPRIAGMVAYFPLEKGEKSRGAMEVMAERKIVRGIRKTPMLGHSGFLRGIEFLRRFGWVYDLNVNPRQLHDVFTLVKSFPDQVFILDHLANPDIVNEDWEAWANSLAPFASMEQVYCKISGMLTRAGAGWKLNGLQPYFDTVLEVFGPDRVVFGGDWPVVLRAGTYSEWMATFYSLSQKLSPEEKEKLYYRNAEKVYDL
ncbi:amidohydrolase family protein [Cyclobacterium jeungdonense]|uniref:Amidohydrolase family protein n=1 Tax=Cyclobacterium jeungdonense TaxID=708087 RepID=A0ABT8C4T4_9BACT|nr:amidohydrolase family protein [Cyclobacterium jeungdonense]MDN3686761.1 amidohydrolase family protein [Cyclobacterium jeungdonense]